MLTSQESFYFCLALRAVHHPRKAKSRLELFNSAFLFQFELIATMKLQLCLVLLLLGVLYVQSAPLEDPDEIERPAKRHGGYGCM